MTNAEMLRKLRADAVAKGLCQQCRYRPQKPGCKTCQRCLDATAARQDKNRAAGLCACGRPTDGRHKDCAACRKRDRDRWRARKPELIAAGRCLMCKDAAKPGRTLCERHLKTSAERTKRQRDQRRTEGLCARFGCKRRPNGDHTLCVKHRIEMREYVRNRRAA